MARSDSDPCMDIDAESTLCIDPDRLRASNGLPILEDDPSLAAV